MSTNFIEREVFAEIARRVDGTPFGDIDTVYGDLSRLVVAWLAKESAEDLRELYNKLGWGGKANARAIHEAAKMWMKTHRPEVSK